MSRFGLRDALAAVGFVSVVLVAVRFAFRFTFAYLIVGSADGRSNGCDA
ncbi:hypothetical protein ACFCXS_27865 [Streptomyces sp. NPDC056373]